MSTPAYRFPTTTGTLAPLTPGDTLPALASVALPGLGLRAMQPILLTETMRSEPAATSASARPRRVWGTARLAAIAEVLVTEVGPIARVLVNRTALQTDDFDDLIARLSASLDEAKQAEFAQRVARLRPWT